MKQRSEKSRLFSHIFILSLVAIIAVTATFSWYDRQSASSGLSGNVLEYKQSGNINGSGCTIKTYEGIDDNGKITYSDINLVENTQSITAKPGKVTYFKTKITNEGNSACAVSAYLENLTYSNSFNTGDIRIGLTQPEKTYKKFTAALSGNSYKAERICLEDNLFIKKDNSIEIYWFVEIAKGTTNGGNINLGTMHIVYN